MNLKFNLSQWQWVGLLAIMGCGALLRFHALERESLWDDEMSTMTAVNLPLSEWPHRFQTYEMHPPLYFLQLKLWSRAAGHSLGALRANSAAWGTLSLLLLFLLGRRYGGAGTGLAATALMACSPYHLAYSQEMRPYAFASALGILGFYVLDRCLEKKVTYVRWLWLLVIMTCELYAHYWGAFVIAAMLVYGLQRSTGTQRIRFLGIAAVSLGLFGAWIPMLRMQLQYVGGLSFWVPPASAANLAKTLMAFTGLYFHHASLAFQAPGPELWLELVGLMTVLIAALGLWERPRLALIWLGVGLGLPYMLSYWVHGIYLWYRYPSLIYPAFVLALAGGLRVLPRRWLRPSALLILILQSLWSCWIYKTAWQKANPKDVMAYVQQLKTSQTVVIRPAYFSPLFAYYDHPPTLVIDQDTLDDVQKRARLKGKKIIFLAFDAPSDSVGAALLSEFKMDSARYFPGRAHLGITVYELQ